MKIKWNKKRLKLFKKIFFPLAKAVAMVFIGGMAMIGIYDTVDFIIRDGQTDRSGTADCDTAAQVEQLKILHDLKVKLATEREITHGITKIIEFEIDNLNLSEEEKTERNLLYNYGMSMFYDLVEKNKEIDKKIDTVNHCYILSDDQIEKYSGMREDSLFKEKEKEFLQI